MPSCARRSVKRMKPKPQADSPAAIVVGGEANALSVARSLSAAGIAVYSLNHPTTRLRYSRACRLIALEDDNGGPKAWADFLVGPRSDHLRGAVILACSDEAIEMIIAHRPVLAEKFILEEGDGEMRLSLLDKLRTYVKAVEAGIPTPRYWRVRTVADLEGIKDELVFPLIIKPLFSHHTRKIWPQGKYLKVHGYDDLHRNFSDLQKHRVEFLLMEFVPGDDQLLCSYYTYMDENGDPLFHFTKRVIRRFPENMGEACYHITDWDPDVRDMGLKLFRHVKLRGLGNVEFKRDRRDGKLKIIECNARFTAANSLVKKSGLDLALLTYNKLTGRPLPALDRYRSGLTLWLPMADYLAFKALRQQGRMSFGGWVLNVLRPHCLPFLSWRDPLPSFAGWWRKVRRMAGARPVQPKGDTAPVR